MIRFKMMHIRKSVTNRLNKNYITPTQRLFCTSSWKTVFTLLVTKNVVDVRMNSLENLIKKGKCVFSVVVLFIESSITPHTTRYLHYIVDFLLDTPNKSSLLSHKCGQYWISLSQWGEVRCAAFSLFTKSQYISYLICKRLWSPYH